MRAVSRPSTTVFVLALAIALSGCAGDAEGGPENVAEEPASASAAREIRVSEAGFETPESVLHDEAADVYLVSNIGGDPLGKDDNGFISRLSPDGQVLDLRWIDGAAEGVDLSAPKGMAIVGDSLYVSDIDCVRVFHRTTGAAAGSVCFEGATFLNDVAADEQGALHVTDSGLTTGFAPSGTDAVWRFTPGGETTRVAEGTELGSPNGIAFGPRGGYVVTFGSGGIFRLVDGGREEVLPPAEGRQLDGIAFTPDGGFLFSSWGESAVFHVAADGNVQRVVEDVDAPADIGYDARRGRVLIPLFNANEVLIQELEMGAAGEGGA